MNEDAGNHKAKGISVEGFWRRLKDKTEKKSGETECPRETDYHRGTDDPRGTNDRDSRDLSEPQLSELHTQAHTDSRDVSAANAGKESYRDEDWVARFDEWLDRL